MLNNPLVLVSGKGGTGKSAIAAAVATERARRGQRVLAIDLGSGSGLADHLGTRSLAYEADEIRPGLYAMTMSRAAALDEYLKTTLRVPSGAPTKTITSALSVLVDTAPGVREIISIGKPVYEIWKGEWDCVIVDTPSLGQFQSYLRAPTTIADIVPSGNVRRQAAALADTLTDPNTTTIVLTTVPAELPVNETRETVATILADHLGPDPQVVMNRAVADVGIDPDIVEALEPGPYREAASHHVAVRRAQSAWMGELSESVVLPFLMGVLTPGEVAVQLADELGSL